MRCGGLYSLRFLSSSQSGWCLLKSPSQSIWSVGRGRAVARFSLRYVWRASMARLSLQLLYMLKIEQSPKSPLRCIVAISLWWIWRAE